jgi:hypothetical protein
MNAQEIADASGGKVTLEEAEALLADNADRVAQAASTQELIDSAEYLKALLETLIATPVPDRDPADVVEATQLGVALTLQSLGSTNETIVRLAGECSRLAQTAQILRLAWEEAQV